MVVTRTERKEMEKEQLQYAIEEVMGEELNSNLSKALEYNNYDSLLNSLDLMKNRKSWLQK